MMRRAPSWRARERWSFLPSIFDLKREAGLQTCAGGRIIGEMTGSNFKLA
jgi:hypothetical protein